MSTEPYLYSLGASFFAAASRHAERTALRWTGGADISYAQLANEVRRTAARLHAQGVRRGTLVALQNDKSLSGLATMLACLVLGAPYTNIDANNPPQRLAHILGVCRPSLILCDAPPAASVCEAASSFAIPTLQLADLPEADAADWGESPVTGTDTAYVMFTSGSTGVPKGVAISHASVLNFVAWSRVTFDITPDDVLTGVNPIYFDNSVFDFYAALFNGACLAPFTPADTKDPLSLVRRIDEAGCTVWFSVPSLLIYLMTVKALQPSTFASIRAIIFGGEGYPKRELSRLHRLYGSRSRLFNVYGPTECTCICSAHAITESDLADDKGLPTLGRIAANFDYAILDGDQRVAPGDAGELCLIGPQVGQGYYNDPERTAAVFVGSPVHRSVRQPMYRTGDFVRETEGQLWFVGRKDNQIKHMGYRIELEEIEAALHRLAYVTQAAVVYNRVRENFGHIVAHIATADAGTDAARLRGDLKSALPDYMMPNRFVIVETLPKNANGKVDRNALKSL